MPRSAAPQPALANQAQRPAEILRALFLERKSSNPAYSTRTFARDLGMSQTLLSLVMNGKRPLSVKQAAQISVLLSFDKERAEQFIESTLLALPGDSPTRKRVARSHQARAQAPAGASVGPVFKNYELERFKAISQWYHVAILDLTTTGDFREDSGWIARRLGISPIEATDALARLLDLGLLVRKENRLAKADNRVFFATQKSEAAVRGFHSQMIGKALDQLRLTDQAAFEARQISAMTMAIPTAQWPRAKALVQTFQQELAALMTSGNGGVCDEVYQLNVQMFPLTKKEK